MSAPQHLLFWIVAALLLLLPGALVARRTPLLWDRLGPGERILPSFLLSAGVAGLAYLLALALRPTLMVALAFWLGMTGALALVDLSVWWRRRRRRRASPGGPRPVAAERLPVPGGRAATRWALLPVVLSALAMLYEGGSLGFMHDSLDFVAYVQRMLLTGRIDLASGAFADVADLAADPRRGVFHLFGAVLCHLSGASAAAMWRNLPVVLVPLSLWVLYAALRRILASAPAALAGLCVFMAATFFTGQNWINNLAYASRIGWIMGFTGLWAVALWLDAGGGAARGAPGAGSGTADAAGGRRGARVRAWSGDGEALALVVIGAPVLLGIHLLSAAQYLVSLGACAWGWALWRGVGRTERRTLIVLPLAALALLLPFLAIKVAGTFSTANPLFDHAQGLLYLGGDWAVLAPRQLWAWYGPLGLLGIVLTLPLARWLRERRDAAFLCVSTWAALAVVLNPLAVRIIEAVHGHSLLFRVMLVAPHFAVVGWWIVRAFASLRGVTDAAGAVAATGDAPSAPTRGAGATRRGGTVPASVGPDRTSARGRVAAVVVLILVAGAAAWHLRDASRRGGGPARQSEAWHELPAVRTALRELDRLAPGPCVIVTDPITSYLVPAYSRHYAIAPFGQHSSPADARTVERIQDARAILNPLVPAGETVRLLRKYSASFVLLYHGFRHRQFFYYAPVDPEVFPAQRAKLLEHPGLFVPVYDRDDVLVCRFVDPGPSWSDTAAVSHPFVALDADDAAGRSRAELAATLGLLPWTGPVVGGLELIGVEARTPPSARRGEALTFQSYWRRTGDPYVLPVAAFVRLETRYPSEQFHHPLWGRVARLWTERRRGEAYRFGRDLEPLAGEYPAFLWASGAVYRAPLTLYVQPNAAPGEYVMEILVREIPFEPNLRLRDLFSLRDSNAGRPMGKAVVEGPGGR